MALPKIGNKAPTFTLKDQQGDNQNLKDYLGSVVVLYFYPKAMTPGCTVQACGIRDSARALNKLDIKVLGVSIDAFPRLAKFAQRDKLNFTLLSDEDHKIADKYDVWGLKKFMGREYMGLKRTTFIIDKEGRLRHIIEKVKTKTHHDDVMSWIKDNLK
ncbi:MAG: thioredoxin-dependent thiol peroxidase [Gammaproteobacteria bacterium]|nr:thioredoxin-dependent thiol peroxidase [Gammaproteobacteria bacterium]